MLAKETARTGTLVVSAIYGLGGIGKSTLAAALAHDPEVQRHFPDGVLWATLGQTPDLLPFLSTWIQALGDYDFKLTTSETASLHLRTLLHNKAILLVVDDVWNSDHVEPFRVGGSNCRVLVTTREAVVKGAVRFDLDVMTKEQASKLLTHPWKGQLTNVQKHQAEALAKTVGYLPLALELAAAQVKDGVSWSELLSDLQAEIARLEVLDLLGADEIHSEEKRKDYSLLASFNLSLRRLPSERREEFVWLGVLPEDVTITEKMAVTLWKCNQSRAKTTLHYLRSKALLLPGVSSDETTSYRLHDLLHDLARNLLTNPTTPEEGQLPGFGLTLLSAHQTLLQHYRAKTKNGLWHTLPDDGYIHNYLTWHLLKAEWNDEVHQLLKEETEKGENGWYQACERLGKIAIYIVDIARAWQLAEEVFSENPSQAIAWQCRYVLIISSLKSLAANIPATLIATLVKKKIWTPALGLTYGKQGKNPARQAEVLRELAPHLPKSLLPQALAEARNLLDDGAHSYRTTALSGLVPYLPKTLLQEALTSARSIRDDWKRVKILSGLVPYLPEILSEALEAARSITCGIYRANALICLAPNLSEIILQEVLAAAQSIPHANCRAEALRELVPYLPEILPEALKAAQSISYVRHRAKALRKLVPYLPEILPEALTAARSFRDESFQAEALTELVPYSPEILLEALTAVRNIPDESARASALSRLAPHLPEILPEALAAVWNIQEENYRARTLYKLIPHLPQNLLLEVLEALQNIWDESARASALSRLAPHLPEILLPEALEAARSIPNESARASALRELASRLPEILPEALAAARSINDDSYRVEALSRLALHLPEILPEALEAVRSIQGTESELVSARVSALSRLAPHLPEILLPKALEAARSISYDPSRVSALSGLVPYLPEILPEALEAARSISYDPSRVSALSGLVPYLPEILPEALEAARSITYDPSRVSALSGLVPYLPEILPEALEAARSIHNESDRAEALSRLAHHLSDEILLKTLATVRSIQHKGYRASSVMMPLPHLPTIMKSVYEQLNPNSVDYNIWKEILHFLADNDRQVVLESIPKLSSIIIALGGSNAFAEIAHAIQDVGQWWP
ncbi:MAG: hypothetical protein F6K51_20555 [Moorea sp. SIO3I8]|nr:hypothetical protein [Moorena sp. SIO3I8]